MAEVKLRRFWRLGFWRPRFSLWAMLVVVTLVSIPLGYVAQRRSWNLKRKAAYERLLGKGFELTTNGFVTSLFVDRSSDPFGPDLEQETEWNIESVWNELCLNHESLELTRFHSGSRGANWSSVNEEDLADLALFPELRDVSLNLAIKIKDEPLSHLRTLESLRTLSISGSQEATGDFFRYLGSLRSLESLELRSLPSLQGDSLPKLQELPRLQTLILRECPQLSDASLRHLDLPATVTRLEIQGKLVGDETVGRWLSQVRPRELMMHASVTRKVSKELARQHLLERLEIFDAPFVDADFAFLGQCDQLKILRLEVMPIRGDFLRSLPSPFLLDELSLDSTLLEDHNLAALPRYKMLSSVKLDWTPISGEGFEGLVDWPKAYVFSLMGTQFSEKGKAAFSKVRGPGLVLLPANWKAEDAERFSDSDPPFGTIPSCGKSQVVGGNYPWNGPLWNKKPRHCSVEDLAPVLRLYELEQDRVKNEAMNYRAE